MLTSEESSHAWCPVCCSVSVAFSFSFSGYRVWNCDSCRLQFLRPQPDDSALSAIYNADYFLGEHDGVLDAEVNRLKQETAALYVNDILALNGSNPGALLEIGSGTGDFLLEARQRGFVVSGLEYSLDAVCTANGRLGEECVQRGEVASADLPDNQFDVVFCSDVIEHVRDPITFVSRLQRSLKPQGLIYIATPSTDSWSRKLMGRRWMEYKPEHLYYFNERSLARLLTDHGFTEVRFAPNYKILSFQYVSAHFQRFRVPFWSAAVRAVGKVVPDKLATRNLKIVASGMVATGRKVHT